MPNIRKTKKYCKHPKSSFSRANIRYVRHPKNQKVLHTCENQLYQGNTSDMSNIRKNKNAANIRKAAFPGQTSDVSKIRKTKKCCKPAKTSFTRANIRYVKHLKNQKVLQTSENQLYHGKHPICQISEKPKSAANIRKAVLPWRTSDLPNIRKTKKCCKHPKSSFSRANIRYVRHPKNQKVLHTCENQLYQGNTSDISNIRKNKKSCKQPKSSFSRANIRCVKHPKNQNVVQTCENQLYQGKYPKCQTSEKPKSAANMRKPVLRGQTSDLSNIQKLKSAANIRKAALRGQTPDMSNIQKLVLQTSEKQLCQGKHPICQTSEKTKSAANIRKAAFPWQTSDVSNIRKTKKCCKPAKTSFTRAKIRYVKRLKNQKVLQTSKNQLYHGEHPICQISEKAKSAANIRKAVLP